MYSMNISHISSNGSNFLTAGSWCTEHIGQEKWAHQRQLEVTMYSKYTTHVSSNGSHFLMASFLVYFTYNVGKDGHIRHS